jgi:hypothetical protein
VIHYTADLTLVYKVEMTVFYFSNFSVYALDIYGVSGRVQQPHVSKSSAGHSIASDMQARFQF